jgi:hypothetical protein
MPITLTSLPIPLPTCIRSRSMPPFTATHGRNGGSRGMPMSPPACATGDSWPIPGSEAFGLSLLGMGREQRGAALVC